MLHKINKMNPEQVQDLMEKFAELESKGIIDLVVGDAAVNLLEFLDYIGALYIQTDFANGLDFRIQRCH